MRTSDSDVVRPGAPEQAIEAFGDGRGVTVFGGGTILMPTVSYGRYPRGGRTLMLDRAGLDEVSDNGTLTIGAMTRLSRLAGSDIQPVAAAAAQVADLEVRGQATIGGNLCAPPGDLQTALLAAGARVRSVGAGGERTESIDDFLARGADDARLVLAIELERPRRAGYISQRRAHAHSYAVMSVACAETSEGTRVAAGGLGLEPQRLTGVERALAEGAAPAESAAQAQDEVQPRDDALASAWYRRVVLPTLVTRVLEQMQGG